MEVLRELDNWSWDGYQERLAAKGYELYLRKDKKDVIRGYVLLKGNTKFKASELGKGRNLTASRIRQTWEKLHSGNEQQVRPATNSQLYRHRNHPFLMVRNIGHSHLYNIVILYSRIIPLINPITSPQSLNMTARPISVIFQTRCLTSSTMSSTIWNWPTGKPCKTLRWLTSL